MKNDLERCFDQNSNKFYSVGILSFRTKWEEVGEQKGDIFFLNIQRYVRYIILKRGVKKGHEFMG